MKYELTCPQCEGAGRVPLSEHLQDTLSRLDSRVGRTAADVSGAATPNAVSNRLVYLFQLGLVKRERVGKFWYYTRTTAKQQLHKRK